MIYEELSMRIFRRFAFLKIRGEIRGPLNRMVRVCYFFWYRSCIRSIRDERIQAVRHALTQQMVRLFAQEIAVRGSEVITCPVVLDKYWKLRFSFYYGAHAHADDLGEKRLGSSRSTVHLQHHVCNRVGAMVDQSLLLIRELSTTTRPAKLR
jgi:hypothetical protein